MNLRFPTDEPGRNHLIRMDLFSLPTMDIPDTAVIRSFTDGFFVNIAREIDNYVPRAEHFEAAMLTKDDPLQREFQLSLEEGNRLTCTFNPAASVERIQRIAALDCVEAVFIPRERYLMKRLAIPREKGVLYHFTEHDRFAVLLKPDCEDW